MTFTVQWIDPAEQKLAALWQEADDPAELSRVVNALDAHLRIDPLSIGESRSGDERVVIVPPVAVLYSCNQDDRVVTVLDIWPISTR